LNCRLISIFWCAEITVPDWFGLKMVRI